MLHIVLHIVVPVLVALVFYRREWLRVTALLLATMAIDADHLLTRPIYDAERCSLGFHPLHTPSALILYGALFAVPLTVGRKEVGPGVRAALRALHVIGLGLLIHMALDGSDCLF